MNRSQMGKPTWLRTALKPEVVAEPDLLEARGDRRAGFLDDRGLVGGRLGGLQTLPLLGRGGDHLGEPLLLAELGLLAVLLLLTLVGRLDILVIEVLVLDVLALLVLVALVGLIVPEALVLLLVPRRLRLLLVLEVLRLLIVPGLLRAVLADLVADVELLRLVRALALVPRSVPALLPTHAAIPGKL